MREPSSHQKYNQQLLQLREAVLAISANLSLTETLKHIVVAAAQLADAKYAALGVPDEASERLVEFVTFGMSPEQENRIGHRPRGQGILGVIMREGKSLRLRDLRHHPLSAGFPDNHVLMKTFLGVPIVYKGKRLGNLYLTEKQNADEFTEADQALIELLAAHAAGAIQNAQLYQATLDRSRELEGRNRELAVLNNIAISTSQHLDLNRVMTEALDQVLLVAGAEAGEIFLLDELSGDMVLALHRGASGEAFHSQRRFKRGIGYPGQVALTGQPIVTNNLVADTRFLRRRIIDDGYVSFACIPLFAKGRVVGCINLASRQKAAFDPSSLTLLTSIGHQIGMAVENARLYKQVTQLAVLEERQRIGMDLHDGVIQSIYAVGLTLEYANGLLDDDNIPAATERLKQAIDALNATIRDIRSYILDLRPRRFDGTDLVGGLKQLVAEFKANTLIAASLNADQSADRHLQNEARLALFHIAQEALSNAAKHSHASSVEVQFVDSGNTVTLSIKDNGRGFVPGQSEQRIGHGMSNMHDRVLAIGGHLAVTSAPNEGAVIKVSIPKNARP